MGQDDVTDQIRTAEMEILKLAQSSPDSAEHVVVLEHFAGLLRSNGKLPESAENGG